RVASANNRIAYGKQTIKDGDVMATKYKRENWMSGPTTGKPRARKEYENVSEYGKSQVAQGMKEKSLADNGMARSRATARGAIQTTLSRMERERVKGNRVRKGAAARKGAVRGGISGFALTSLALLVAKELQKKKD
ncbi:MAG: hypothetical protein EBW68_01635, partial [Actinobacteria bacterium]|nr:hypothetical protein [Actinomycetota bacterium]